MVNMVNITNAGLNNVKKRFHELLYPGVQSEGNNLLWFGVLYILKMIFFSRLIPRAENLEFLIFGA